MPNWATASMDISGTKENVLKFSRRIITSEGPLPGTLYFARTFFSGTRRELESSIEECFNGTEENTASVPVDFAWSATTCIGEDDPIAYWKSAPECISLVGACKEDCVDVHVFCYEPGMRFEEDIRCDRTGNYSCTCEDMQEYVCPECGAAELIPSTEDPEEWECCECGNIGFEIQ